MKRILFVDDEIMVLNGLKRLLRSYRKEWSLHFATSAKEALEVMESNSFDVVVSDMRMPEMDGATFLNIVKEKYPQVMRIVLSGQSQLESIYKVVGATHQYLSKPCDPKSLKNTINRASSLQEIFKDDELRKLVSRIESLPSLPQLYLEIMEEVKSPNMSMKKVGNIISQDIAMTAKILHLVNSAFFGLSNEITDPTVATNLLGLDIILSLVLVVKVFSKFDNQKIEHFSIESEWQHSIRVSELAKTVASSENLSKAEIDLSFLAAMLHDCGKLVLAENLPELYGQILSKSQEEDRPLHKIEIEYWGVDHGVIGAYLMNLWGLPQTIIETIAFHHRWDIGLTSENQIGSIILFANFFDNNIKKTSDLEVIEKLEIDKEIKERFQKWSELCLYKMAN